MIEQLFYAICITNVGTSMIDNSALYILFLSERSYVVNIYEPFKTSMLFMMYNTYFDLLN